MEMAIERQRKEMGRDGTERDIEAKAFSPCKSGLEATATRFGSRFRLLVAVELCWNRRTPIFRLYGLLSLFALGQDAFF